MKDDGGYNRRLFGKRGLRSYLHSARYHWVRRAIARHAVDCSSVVELGCFDGKLLDWLPSKPSAYFGFDANWEGGLEIGRARFRGDDSVSLFEITTPEELVVPARTKLGVAMETLEHVPPALLEPYLQKLAAISEVAIFTVPNEIGPVFALKHAAKLVKYGGAEDYSFSEYIWQSLGQSQRVARNQHKGFDYRRFIRQVENSFSTIEVSGIPSIGLPPVFSFGVGVVARPR